MRANYSGPIGYGANWDRIDQVGFWSELDFIGVSAFWPVSDVATADVGALMFGWIRGVSELEALSTRTGKPVLFTEAGYLNAVGSTVEPWDEFLDTPRSDETQAAAYEALLRVFDPRDWFVGVHWWEWIRVGDTGYSPEGLAAQSVLDNRYR